MTTTPRQRIVIRRELQRLKDSGEDNGRYDALWRDFPYMVLHTCAVDGLCATDCPVSIDTGKLTKRFRHSRHTPTANAIAVAIAGHMKLVEYGARFGLWSGHLVERIFGLRTMVGITRVLDKIQRKVLDEAFWQWSKEMPYARRGNLPKRVREGASAVYFPACISRMMGPLPGEPQDVSVMQAFLNVADRAGVKVFVPPDVEGNCCGVPFSSKGFEEANKVSVNRTIENFWTWSQEGALPVVIDTSPCTYGLRTAGAQLTPENRSKLERLKILDSIEFAHDYLLPKLTINRKLPSAALHPVCSAMKMNVGTKLAGVANACSESVLMPQNAGCCGFAGDRGFLFPELTASATRIEAAEVSAHEHGGYFSSSRTCEIGMTRATGKIYRSYLHLLDWATREQ